MYGDYPRGAIFPEPSLLRTCKAIRHEALSIYYFETNFEIRMWDFSCDTFAMWRRKLKNVMHGRFKVRHSL
jgi:hypothetical protein